MFHFKGTGAMMLFTLLLFLSTDMSVHLAALTALEK